LYFISNLAFTLEKPFMRNLLNVLVFILIADQAVGQFEPKHTFTVELGMPTPVANASYRKITKGLVAVSPYYQYRLPSSLALGAGLHYQYLQINPLRVPSAEQVSGGIHSLGAFFKVGHEKFHNERFATDVGLKIGYNQTFFKTNFNEALSEKTTGLGAIFAAPILGLILNVDEFSSYRFTLGYCLQGYQFNYQRLGVVTNDGIIPKGKTTQSFIFGFGFTHYFSKVKN
jgi:hypothetical protein